jgi:hypothetical protein
VKLRGVPGLVLALLVIGCGGTPGTSPFSSVPPPVAGPVETVEVDRVRVSLAVELAELPIAGRTWAAVTIENLGPGIVLWQGGGCEIPAQVVIDLAGPVQAAAGQEWTGIARQFKDLLWRPSAPSDQASFQDERLIDAGQPVGCPANLAVNELAPGETIRTRAAWDGDVAGAAAPAGLATIRAAFPYMGPKRPGADPFAAPLRPIEVSASVAVVDRGLGLVSPGQAIDAALADDRFARRVSALPMERWEGVELRTGATEYVVIHSLLNADGVRIDARVTVDRHSGNLLSYVEAPRQVQ